MTTRDPLSSWLGRPGTPSRHEGESLCLALSADSSPANALRFRELYDKIGDARLWEIAKREHMEGIVGHALERASIPSSQRWKDAHAEVEATIREYMAVMDTVAAKLAGEGIPMVALKNAGIARAIYPCLGCCPMGDLDLLVRRSDFVRAHEVMLADGFHFEFRSALETAQIEHAIRGGGTEYSKTLHSGRKLWVEVQWRPVAGRWIRPDQEPSADELIERSLTVAGTHVRILCAEDNLLQVALHTAKHSYLRAPGFRLHSDVDRIVRLQDVNWPRYVNSVKRLKVVTATYFSLRLGRDLLGTPIPGPWLDSVSASRFKQTVLIRWIRSAGLFGPDDRKFGRFGYILFVACLYDSLTDLARSMFPSTDWMMEHYHIRTPLVLPWFYVQRLVSLATKRVLQR